MRIRILRSPMLQRGPKALTSAHVEPCLEAQSQKDRSTESALFHLVHPMAQSSRRINEDAACNDTSQDPCPPMHKAFDSQGFYDFVLVHLCPANVGNVVSMLVNDPCGIDPHPAQKLSAPKPQRRQFAARTGFLPNWQPTCPLAIPPKYCQL
jgi:hypothetical protein